MYIKKTVMSYQIPLNINKMALEDLAPQEKPIAFCHRCREYGRRSTAAGARGGRGTAQPVGANRQHSPRVPRASE